MTQYVSNWKFCVDLGWGVGRLGANSGYSALILGGVVEWWLGEGMSSVLLVVCINKFSEGAET